MKPVQKTNPRIEVNELGIPSINFGYQEVTGIDFAAAIAEGREERDQKYWAMGKIYLDPQFYFHC